MKQFCELTKPISNKQFSMINIKSQQTSNNNDKNIDEKSEELRLSKTNCLPKNNKSLKIEKVSTNSQHDLTMNNANFNNIKVNLHSYFKKYFFLCTYFTTLQKLICKNVKKVPYFNFSCKSTFQVSSYL